MFLILFCLFKFLPEFGFAKPQKVVVLREKEKIFKIFRNIF